MVEDKEKSFAIIGAGLGGLCLAIALKRIGFENITVFEKVENITNVGSGMSVIGTSLQLLSDLGVNLDNVAHKQLDISLRSSDSTVLFQVPTTIDKKLTEKFGCVQYNVHRGELQLELVRILGEKNIKTNHKYKEFILRDDNKIEIFFENKQMKYKSYYFDYLISAEGINSKIRNQIFPKKTNFLNYSGYSCWRGLTDNSNLPQTTDKMYKTITNNSKVPFSFTTGRLEQGRIFWALDIVHPKNTKKKNLKKFLLNQLKTDSNISSEILDIISQTNEKDIIQTDIYDGKYLNNYSTDNIALIGDAAHPMVHHFGQGACLAIEDGILLASCIEKYGPTKLAFKKYSSRYHIFRSFLLVLISKFCGIMYMTSKKFKNSIKKKKPFCFE